MEGLPDDPAARGRTPGPVGGRPARRRGGVLSGRRVVFWRHGRTAWNAESRFQGQLDVELDETGFAQARRAARLLAALSPAALVSSDLRRASETAQALGGLTGLGVTADKGLREVFAGEWQGLSGAELRRPPHADAFFAWVRGADVRPGGGETRAEVGQRALAAVERALPGVPDGATLVAVTHGGAARAAIALMMGLPLATWTSLGALSNCSWSVLAEPAPDGPPMWRLLEHNAGSLPEPVLGDER